MDWTTFGVALVGFGAGAVTPLLTGWYTTRTETRTWRRDRLASVLVDAVAFSQAARARINAAVDPRQITRAPALESPDTLAMSAELRIFAPEKVFDAWAAFLDANEALWYNAEAEWEDSPRPAYEPALDMNNPDIDRVFGLIDRFQVAVKSDFA